MNHPSLSSHPPDDKPDLTPMIDVTFLLLVFFLCSIRFKVLEGKLEAALPKHLGSCPAPYARMLETLDVVLTRDADTLSVTVNGRRAADLDTLSGMLTDYRSRIPRPASDADDDGEDELKLKLDARDGVLHEDVVAVVDRVLAAQIHDVVFTGARDPR